MSVIKLMLVIEVKGRQGSKVVFGVLVCQPSGSLGVCNNGMRPPETRFRQAGLPMDAIATGIAHVSFVGGGTFLPTRTPYQRQMLVEHVLQCVRANGQVQVLIHDQRWMVRLRSGESTGCCSHCGSSLGSVVYSTGDAIDAYCAECALGGKQGNAMRCAPLPVITDAA